MTSEIREKYRVKQINWGTTIFLGLFHIGAIAALFMFSWQSFVVAVVLYWVSGSLGIGVGYHRLLTHRGLKVPKPLEYFLAICGTLALQGGPIFWVGLHRIHHAKADREGDPHSPREGFFWSHMGWIIFGSRLYKDKARRYRYTPDLVQQPFYVWLSEYHYVPQAIVGLMLLAAGGWPMLLWGLCLRNTISWHVTWFVNSATHVWGYRRFASNDDSRNNWWVALLSFGEGWHNNHHAHASSARHGLAWYEFDLNWIVIRTLQFLGLAKDIRKVDLATAPRKLEEQIEPALQSAN
ncbi:MAG: fatty acid desaturase [Acidobacteria bacterium]|nr:fatty acid desaturase [Acidobacteriota bacterium]